MGEKESYIVTITYLDGNFETWENVRSVSLDGGMVAISCKEVEIEGNRILHQRYEVPIHRIRKMNRSYVCTIADHKANEALYESFKDQMASSIRLITGYAGIEETETDGDDAS